MIRTAALVLFALPAAAQEVLTFTDETATSGVVHSYIGEWEQIVGGGVASFDCNADALPDLVLAGGTGPARLMVNTSQKAGPLAFVAQDAGVELAGVSGAYPIDIDSDGITDLALLRVGENILMRGLGECRFENANTAWGFEGGDAWSTAFAATWEKGAAFPTLAIGNYINRHEEAFPWGSCTDNWLHRPDGKRYAPPLPLTPSFCALSMLFTDWNASGQPALRVSNDREYYEGGQEQLWHLDPGQPPRLYTEAEGWQRLRIWGMGIASTDLDANGTPEFFLTSMADSKLQTLADPATGKPKYADVAFAKGVTAHRPYTGGDLRPSTGWHAQFGDVNNDGRSDLFVAKGNVWDMPDFAAKDPNNLLLQRQDGTFTEVGDKAGVASMESARGASLTDFNGDGALDLIVVNRNSPAQIWRNVGPVGNYATIVLQQPAPNPQAIGAWIELRTEAGLQRHEVTIGGGHASGTYGPMHFGLGTAKTAEARVLWPGGLASDWQPVVANTTTLLTR